MIQQAAQGDITTFKKIVETHKKKVFYLAYDLTGQVEDAEDLAQEVFVKAFKGLKNFKGESGIGSWLYRITFNAFIDQKRKKSVRPEGQPQESNERAMELITNPTDQTSANPEVFTESIQIQSHINAALDELSPRERAVFILKHYQGNKIKEISQILSISEGTIKSLLFRAIRKLQEKLAFYKPNQEEAIQ